MSLLANGASRGLGDLIGREDDIATVARLADRCRLVSLTGPSGIGKTRLAIEVARRAQDSHPSRAELVELASVSDPSLVVQSVASVLGLQAQPGSDPLDALVADLAPLSMLVVLDNCEHVAEAVATIVESVLVDCPGVSVLATTQRPLGVTGEHVRPVLPLSLPDGAASPEAAAASRAVALFCARAAAVTGFELTDDVVAAVVGICRHLDGIPLAIELAAARTPTMGPADIADRLQQRFPLLTKPSRGAPPRHQSRRAAIDWSYELIGDRWHPRRDRHLPKAPMTSLAFRPRSPQATGRPRPRSSKSSPTPGETRATPGSERRAMPAMGIKSTRNGPARKRAGSGNS